MRKSVKACLWVCFFVSLSISNTLGIDAILYLKTVGRVIWDRYFALFKKSTKNIKLDRDEKLVSNKTSLLSRYLPGL